MASRRVGGLIQVSANGVLYDAKGNFSYNLGRPKRTAVVGSNGVHGFTEEAQPAFIEGEITDRATLDLAALANLEDATITLTLANTKVVMLREAWFAGEGTGNSEQGNIPVRWEAPSGEEV